jgi:hypothetical protein
MNCELWITFITTTHSDRERSRVGIQFYEAKMRLTTFLEMLIRLTVPFSLKNFRVCYPLLKENIGSRCLFVSADFSENLQIPLLNEEPQSLHWSKKWYQSIAR